MGCSRFEEEEHGAVSQQTWVRVPAQLELTSHVTLASPACWGNKPTHLMCPWWSSKVTKPRRQPAHGPALRKGVPLQGGLLCLCGHPCGPSRRLFSFLMLFTLQFGHVTWSPACNGTSVCGSTVACETFGQEASADGWQPLHMA